MASAANEYRLFRKPVTVQSQTALKSSAAKKLRQAIAECVGENLAP
jgi:hypothetical protein